jgi:hypothetical protein
VVDLEQLPTSSHIYVRKVVMVEVGGHDLSRSYDGDDLEAWALLLSWAHLHACVCCPSSRVASLARRFLSIGNVSYRPRTPIFP